MKWNATSKNRVCIGASCDPMKLTLSRLSAEEQIIPADENEFQAGCIVEAVIEVSARPERTDVAEVRAIALILLDDNVVDNVDDNVV